VRWLNEYKFIKFEKSSTVWVCRNRRTNGILGYVAFYSPWRAWVFSADSEAAIFSWDCLRDISQFIVGLNVSAKPSTPKKGESFELLD